MWKPRYANAALSYCRFCSKISVRDIWGNSSTFVNLTIYIHIILQGIPCDTSSKIGRLWEAHSAVLLIWQSYVVLFPFFTLHRLWCFPTNYMRSFLRRSSPLLTSLFAFTEEHCSVSPKFYESCAANSFIKVFMLQSVNILAWTSALTVQHWCRHDALIFIYLHAKNIHCLTALHCLLCLQLLMYSFWVKHFKHSFRYCRKSSLLAFRYCIKESLLPPKSFLQAANGGSIIQVLFLYEVKD